MHMKKELFIKGEKIPLLSNQKWSLLTVSLMFLCLFFSAVGSYASTENNHTSENFQQKKTARITGEIKDDSGELLLGVSVIVKGTSIGTVTNMRGRYVLTNVPAGDRKSGG